MAQFLDAPKPPPWVDMGEVSSFRSHVDGGLTITFSAERKITLSEKEVKRLFTYLSPPAPKAEPDVKPAAIFPKESAPIFAKEPPGLRAD